MIALLPLLVPALTARAMRTPCVLRVHETQASRNLPYAFYDQGVASLRAMYPASSTLVARRTGRLGHVEYSLLAWRQAPTADAALPDTTAGLRTEER